MKSNGSSFIIYYEVKGILRKGRLKQSLEGSPRKWVVMTGKSSERDIKARYEFLIAGIVVALLCILAFVAFKITGYLNGARASGTGETTLEASDGTVLIEVAIRETTNPDETVEETEATEPGRLSKEVGCYDRKK